MKDVELKTFPSNRLEALTMLHLQNQDLTNHSPRELVKVYWEVNKELRLAFKDRVADKDGYPSIK